MGFGIGAIVFVGGSLASLFYLGFTWQAGVCCALAFLLGSKLGGK